MNDVKITVIGGELSEKEKEAYVLYLHEKYKHRKLKSLEITVDGEYVDLNYEFQPQPFERIRRITGYLVGTMDKWNNGKAAEEADRGSAGPAAGCRGHRGIPGHRPHQPRRLLQ